MRKRLIIFLSLVFLLASPVFAAVGKSKYSGDVTLQNFEDKSYDWGHTVIRAGNLYKMWWVHGNPFDELFYAESEDCLHWRNIQKVMDAAVTRDEVKKGDYDSSDWEFLHVGSPTVVVVNGTYYMFYEAPKTVNKTTLAEKHNNIFLATSKDGKSWKKYPNNETPQPVIRMPSLYINNDNNKYGVGQPKVLYRNGQFEIYFTCDLYGGNAIYSAVSKDGITWKSSSGSASFSDFDRIIEGHTLDIKYSTSLKKYIMAFSVSNRYMPDADPGAAFDYGIFYAASSDRLNWSNDSILNLAVKKNNVFSGLSLAPKTRAFPGFVSNEQGLVEGNTFHILFCNGNIHDEKADWRTECATWNGSLVSFNPKEYASMPVTLPAVKTAVSGSSSKAASSVAVSSRQQTSSAAGSHDSESGTSSLSQPASQPESEPQSGVESEVISSKSVESSAADVNANEDKDRSPLVWIVAGFVIVAAGAAAFFGIRKVKQKEGKSSNE